jgi:large repetitive protein
VDETLYSDPATSGSTFRWDGEQYHYNWNTAKSQTNFYWRIGVQLDDGQTYFVNVGLR